jgi:hypothetical protein
MPAKRWFRFSSMYGLYDRDDAHPFPGGNFAPPVPVRLLDGSQPRAARRVCASAHASGRPVVVCGDCGRIEHVEMVSNVRATSSGHAVLGGVVGGVVAGKPATPSEASKPGVQVLTFRIGVRMDDGRRFTLHQPDLAAGLRAGSRIRVGQQTACCRALSVAAAPHASLREPRNGDSPVRLIVLFLVGLVVGAAGTLIAINSLNRHTPWSKATMAVMGQQMKAVGGNVKANHCATTDFAPKLQTLRLVANDIEPAFGEDGKDPQFGRYAADLRAAADACPGQATGELRGGKCRAHQSRQGLRQLPPRFPRLKPSALRRATLVKSMPCTALAVQHANWLTFSYVSASAGKSGPPHPLPTGVLHVQCRPQHRACHRPRRRDRPELRRAPG